MDKKEIEKQAKEILDKFAKALSKIEEEKEIAYVDREEFERKEGGEVSSDKRSEALKNADKSEVYCDFKKELLENAPKKDNDFIIGEKREWK